MRHVREHFSMELMLDDTSLSRLTSKNALQYAHGIAAMSSNHTANTAKAVYAGVFERNRCVMCKQCILRVVCKQAEGWHNCIVFLLNPMWANCEMSLISSLFGDDKFISIGGLRKAQVRDKLEFSRKYNRVVLGFDGGTPRNQPSISDGVSHFVSQLPAEQSQHHLNHFLQPSQVPDSRDSHEGFLSQGDEKQGIQSTNSQEMLEIYQEKTPRTFSQVTSKATEPRPGAINFAAIAVLLKVAKLRPFQQAALELLLSALPNDTKLIQAPTSVGKDLLPFGLALYTKKAQLVFVPYVALVGMIVLEGFKYGCRVVKFTDIGKLTSIETAAATADVFVLSYEHAPRAVRLAQELESRSRLGWCFFNEAHVAVVDADFRDFNGIQRIAQFCPQVCCMTATLQPHFTSVITSILGRPRFSRSILLSPQRNSVTLEIKMSLDPRAFIAEDLSCQEENRRAIVFCLYKKNVEDMARLLRSKLDREVFSCTSGATADLAAFSSSHSAVMVSTTVLAAGVNFDCVTRIYFLDGTHGPEILLQGAGRGARTEGETCLATLVTSKQQLEFLKDKEGYIGTMANFCQTCFQDKLNFAEELYRLFEHRKPGDVDTVELQQESLGSAACSGRYQPQDTQARHLKRKLLLSPTQGTFQLDQFAGHCHNDSSQRDYKRRALDSPTFTPIKKYQASVQCPEDLSQKHVHRRIVSSSVIDFGYLARCIMACRVPLLVPEILERCEGNERVVCKVFMYLLLTHKIQVAVENVQPSQTARFLEYSMILHANISTVKRVCCP
jgi:superfamily II DNA helicase RecQ